MATPFSKRTLTAFLFFPLLAVLAEFAAAAAPVLLPRVLDTFPHNPGHFTQGLAFHRDLLIESSGLYGASLLAVKDPVSGEILREKRLPASVFAEGCAVAGEYIVLLSWREETAFILASGTLEEKARFFYPGEGWGLAYDGERLIRSDGTDTLYFHAPPDTRDAHGDALGSLAVRDGETAVTRLNELEWCPEEGLLLANIWLETRIAAIDPDTGQVRFWLDIADLVPGPVSELASELAPQVVGGRMVTPDEMTANGLALAPDGKSLWLTGKCWPRMFRIAWPPEAFLQSQ